MNMKNKPKKIKQINISSDTTSLASKMNSEKRIISQDTPFDVI